jgi:transcription antitermination factor NusG
MVRLHVRSQCERLVCDSAEALGIVVHLPVKVEVENRRGWKAFVMTERPLWATYLFAEPADDDELLALHQMPEVISVAACPDRMTNGFTDAHGIHHRGLRAMLAKADADAQERKSLIEAGERVTAYNPGELLEVFLGPLAAQAAHFVGMVKNADPFMPMLNVEMEFMGGKRTVQVAANRVRKAVR